MTKPKATVGKNHLILEVYVQPGAKTFSLAGLHDDRLKLRIPAPPVEGKANEALISELANFLGLSKKSIVLQRGDKSRIKRLHITADKPQVVLKKLGL